MLLTFRRIATNGISLQVGLAGPPDAPLVLLLHGFPEGHTAWRHQVPALLQAGFRVAVPDQRGYGASDKPANVASYQLDVLAQDVVGLLDALHAPQAHIVGHDWGGAVAWWVAQQHPARVDRFSVLNCPHPSVMQRALMRDPTQLARSWYMFAFQLPQLPEAWLSRDDFAPLVRALRASARPDTFDDRTVERLKESWREPGALTAMLNWYRAALRTRLPRPLSQRIAPPGLLLWGRRDTLLGPGLAEASIARCADGRVIWLPEASHWLHHEAPERVNQLLLRHLQPRLVTAEPVHERAMEHADV